jgi:hypothetical protein
MIGWFVSKPRLMERLMPWELDSPDVWIDLDRGGMARQIRHIQQPFPDGNGSPEDPLHLAVTYLTAVMSLLHLQQAQIERLHNSIAHVDATGSGRASSADGAQLRWRRLTLLRDQTAVITIQQTYWAPISRNLQKGWAADVYGAGIRIVMHRDIASNRWRVTDLNDTLRLPNDFHLADNTELLRTALIDPVDEGLDTFIDFDKARSWLITTLPMFGLPPPVLAPDVRRWISQEPVLWLYRFEPGRKGVGATGPGQPPKAGSDYIAWGFRVLYPGGIAPAVGGRPAQDMPGQDLIVRFDGTPLARLELIADAAATTTGTVFPIDPASASGDVAEARPNAFSKALNPHRVSQPLARLAPPTPGSPRMQHLTGDNVYIFDPNVTPGPHAGSIGIAPPVLPAGAAFDFDARTNDFAAVNAYYHTDALFQMVADFGLPFSDNPTGVTTPMEVVHRASIQPGTCNDGRCINAQFLINGPDPTFSGPVAPSFPQIRFALADLHLNPGTTDFPMVPLGIAADVRVVRHEFSHALIYAATDGLELDFVHSFGDSLAAVMSDPDSALANDTTATKHRGLTFPWVSSPLRRHDRTVDEGWSWTSRIGEYAGYHHDMRDLDGYHREQVLSSTMFRLYRAIGGDALLGGMPDYSSRRAAADYVAYLLVLCVAGLGAAKTVPVVDAGIFATALMDADIGTPVFIYGAQTRVGGAVHKVIRWAFEMQGLYPRPGYLPGFGSPPPIDVFIDDGRGGSYEPVTPPSYVIWNRLAQDGIANTAHQAPKSGVDNFIYVCVGNRGDQPANGVTVTIRWQPAGPGLFWPSAAWQIAPPVVGDVAAAGPFDQNTNLLTPNKNIFGPFTWHPPANGRYAILAEADVAGDRANIEPSTGLPCAIGRVELSKAVVPFDNNLGLTTWTAGP